MGEARTARGRRAGIAGLALLGLTCAGATPAIVRPAPEPAKVDHLYGFVAKSNEAFYFYRPPTVIEQVQERMDGLWLGLRGRLPTPAAVPVQRAGRRPTDAQQGSAGLATLALSFAVWLAYRVRRRRTSLAASSARLPVVRAIPYHRFARMEEKPVAALPAPPAARPPLRLTILSDLKGSLSALPMGAVLQMLGAECATGVLHIEDDDGSSVGQMSLLEGRVRDASASNLRGKEALFDLVRRRTGAFRFSVEATTATPKTIQEDLVSLLLEAHRLMDETVAGATAGPQAA